MTSELDHVYDTPIEGWALLDGRSEPVIVEGFTNHSNVSGDWIGSHYLVERQDGAKLLVRCDSVDVRPW